MQKQQENNLCSKFIKTSLSENFCDNCGREEWYHPNENDYKIIFYNEGFKRATQNNLNKAEAGYNAKWFKRGGLFGYDLAKQTMYSEDEMIQLLEFEYRKQTKGLGIMRKEYAMKTLKEFNKHKK